ncbi:hypothetical protein [Mannheimia sp. ZY171111]|uniref:hypothetical protein n=1 Tax=Mannheimia sp. ZY171111 TaxID=2679995 RepID=UPI001ADDD846|nr:hypothetical protein [Mannheimia sp. ZY171111]QTM01918.1 hypothetical protein GM698_10145 [Mannheimia sp. ZY171111]
MNEIDILTSDEFSSLNAYRKLADAIVKLLTKAQLTTLKSRLAFDPRKLPLSRETLVAVFKPWDKPEVQQLDNLEQKYIKLLDEFAKLIEPQQHAALNAYAKSVAQQIEVCEQDNALDSLELLLGELLNFLQTARKP